MYPERAVLILFRKTDKSTNPKVGAGALIACLDCASSDTPVNSNALMFRSRRASGVNLLAIRHMGLGVLRRESMFVPLLEQKVDFSWEVSKRSRLLIRVGKCVIW